LHTNRQAVPSTLLLILLHFFCSLNHFLYLIDASSPLHTLQAPLHLTVLLLGVHLWQSRKGKFSCLEFHCQKKFLIELRVSQGINSDGKWNPSR
jgi:hypothetical protein